MHRYALMMTFSARVSLAWAEVSAMLSWHSSKVAEMPTASIAVSTPRPPGQFHHLLHDDGHARSRLHFAIQHAAFITRALAHAWTAWMLEGAVLPALPEIPEKQGVCPRGI